MRFAEVAVPLPIFQLFSYSVPQSVEDLQEGCRVLVPFGKRKMTGYVVNISDSCKIESVKPIYDQLEINPSISSDLLLLAKWISNYYLSPIGEVFKAMLPAGINQESFISIKLIKPKADVLFYLRNKKVPLQGKILNILLKEREITLQQLRKNVRSSDISVALARLEQAQLIGKEIIIADPQAKPKYEAWIKLSQDLLNEENFNQAIKASAIKQAEVLKILKNQKEISQKNLLMQTGFTISIVNTLHKKNLIEKYQKEVFRSYFSMSVNVQKPKITLNKTQQTAVDEISKSIQSESFRTFLIHGVTGSGKTQVYIETIKETLSVGKSAIVLVPEISLTPQTVSRFTQNFPGLVAVLHSRMSQGERYDSWRKLKEGSFKIAIGPRSAIFAPLKNLGLIVVDEEHEASYKQYESQPLYHARDVAVYRGKLNDAVVLLGSATPSLESYYNALTKKYQLVELPDRVENIPMPEVQIVDMLVQRKMYPKQPVSILSKILQEKIKEKLEKKQQVILLQNRRGFSTHIKCKDCGYIESCENCNITLTYHITHQVLKCHYCNFTKKAPMQCPNCQGSDILFKGIGTQKIEKEISDLIPGAKVVRMDMDTTSKKWAHHKILDDFAAGKYNILLGTQMVAKGLDFANVTLVGVISADTGLLFPDFRATERTFQLLTQVAGRAGRKNLTGEVIIQTYSPEEISLKFARNHDFRSFFSNEIHIRKELNYPPFDRIVSVLFKGEDEKLVQLTAELYFSKLQLPENIGQILGPIVSPISKIQKSYRWQIIIKNNKNVDPAGNILRQHLMKALAETRAQKELRNIKVIIDIDPISLL